MLDVVVPFQVHGSLCFRISSYLCLVDWSGHTEVRLMTPSAAFELALELHQQLQDLGRERFALQHLPLTPSQRKTLEQRLSLQ